MHKQITIPNISCGHCTQTIECELSELAGITAVRADQSTKQVDVRWEPPADWVQINALLEEIGYPPEQLIQQ